MSKPKPKPANTDDAVAVAELPERCPRCTGAERTLLAVVSDQPISGTLPDGRAFDRVVWRQARCLLCGQLFRVRFFQARAKMSHSSQ